MTFSVSGEERDLGRLSELGRAGLRQVSHVIFTVAEYRNIRFHFMPWILSHTSWNHIILEALCGQYAAD